MEQYADISTLLLKHIREELTPEESAELKAWVEGSDKNRQFFNEIDNPQALMEEVNAYDKAKQIDVDDAWKKLQKAGWEEPVTAKQKRIDWVQFRTIAAVLLGLSIFPLYLWLFVYSKKETDKPVITDYFKSDAAPSTNQAFLTRYDGATISLDSFRGNLQGDLGCIQVEKEPGGELSYTEDGYGISGELLYNKVSVPKGGNVVNLQLADGSRVWLNAGSSLTYPVPFNKEERKVEITGEAYFEVAAAESKSKTPFIVSKGDVEISVLGAKFNVNAYYNEPEIKVTLLAGSVKVNKGQLEAKIQNGQQAILDSIGIKVANKVNLDEVMAWKNGKFVFDNTNIQQVMRQLERWYDLGPTHYESDMVKNWQFNGEISRYNNASKVLELLEKTGSVYFEIEGKKIIVTQ